MKRYYITDRKAVGGLERLLAVIEEQLQAGTDYLQIREKDLGARELFQFVKAVVARRDSVVSGRQTKILVNTRADIAIACGADGVHLPSQAPRETPSGLVVFRSCHTLEEVARAQCDAVTFGPVFDSPGKGAPVGIGGLRAACGYGTPVFALGGITWDNAIECVQAGATGVAGIRLFQSGHEHKHC